MNPTDKIRIDRIRSSTKGENLVFYFDLIIKYDYSHDYGL